MSKSMEDEKELIEKLLRMVKREVKQIMEEAVTRKFIHEDSGSITSLCATVDVCLSHGLKRRALGLFKTNSTTALLQKVAKNCETAAIVLRKVQEIENNDPNKRSSSSSDSMNRTRMSFKLKSSTNQQTNGSQNNSNNANPSGNVQPPTKHRYLWIRIALFEKYLVSIVDHVVQNSSKYYERDALVADPVAGQILASLLVGPCALDFTKMRTQDQFWNDPPADELVQRHKISSSIGSTSNAASLTQSTPPLIRKRLGMNYKKSLVLLSNGGGDDLDHASGSPVSRTSNICWSPRDYVESLHQNSKSTLLYGKNNVVMQPSDVQEPMPGYLSLHQHSTGLTIKWTPNQLINGRVGQSSSGEENIISSSLDKTNAFWNYSLNVNVENIVYLHCHQQKQSCGSIVMVGRDGVMHPPILFPKGGHLLAFLSCLETGLIPYGQLDPPLWSEKGKGKILPKLRRKARSSSNDSLEDNNEDIATDYVFRIISMCDKSDDIWPEMFEPKSNQDDNQPPNDGDPQSKTTIENDQTLSRSMSSSNGQSEPEIQNQIDADKQNLQLLCDSMKKQIISRAFYGWLAYCRHFKTVRTHLAVLVNPKIYPIDQPTDASKGITAELWTQIQGEDGRIKIDPMEFHRLVYYGGVEHSIRSQVWLYLLQHHDLDDDEEMKKQHDQQIRHKYEMIMSEWLAVEAIVRQRDKEIVAANLAKLSSESTNNDSQEMSMDKPILQTCKSLQNEVFEDGNTTNDQIVENKENGLRRSSSTGDTIALAKNVVVPPKTDTSEDVENICEAKATNPSRKPLVRHKQIESITSVGSMSGSSVGAQNIFITNPSVDRPQMLKTTLDSLDMDQTIPENGASTKLPVSTIESGGSQCVSPASSNGGLYTNELLDLFSLNLHRIDKDVQRCDRNFWYFSKENLEKLRNVMCTYVWDHLEIGYVQGMCDLVAPLLVIFDDEVYTYSCFCKLMKRMASNFPNGGAMDRHFANMRSLIQILDADIFELMHQNGDYTHFYFCYRWFLLDFKREFNYDDVFSVWETIWAAQHVSSSSFVLFIALALVEYYRDIILENNMDFTDIIKFFNEMAERHDAKAVLNIARDLVHQIQTLMENK